MLLYGVSIEHSPQELVTGRTAMHKRVRHDSSVVTDRVPNTILKQKSYTV